MTQPSGRTLDVARFLEERGMTPFHYYLLAVSCGVTFFDGLDFALVSVTLPYLREEMALTETMIGLVSSAAFLGQMIGSLLGSYIADIVGRRPVIIWCTVLSAVLTFVTGYADGPWLLFTLRLLGGLSIGGLLAPAWSINVESMPAGKKALAVTIIMLGFSVGGAVAGQVTNLLAPGYGWESVFFACGAATGVLALLLVFTMPESLRWLVAKNRDRARIEAMIRKFDPESNPASHDGFTLSDERRFDAGTRSGAGGLEAAWGNFRTTMGQLFKGSLAFITPLIWFTYFCSSFAIYLKSSFGVLFLVELGIDRIMANNIGSIGGIVGALGSVVLLALTERRGPAWIAIAPLLGIPLALAIGSGALLSGPAFIPVVLLGSIMVSVGHAAVISLTSIYYPSAVRSTGGGWASFMAKFAAVAAPNIGAAWFLSNQQEVLDGYLFTGLCLAGVVAGLLLLAIFARRLAAEQQAEAVAAE